MADATSTLQILVQLKDEASTGLKSLGSSFQDVSKNLAGVGVSMVGIGAALTAGVTAPIVNIAKSSLQTASDFQASMELIRTQAGATQEEVDNLTQSVLNLAQTQQQTPIQLSQALFHLESLGLHGADAMNALKVASDGAAISQTDLESVANALGGAISSTIKGTSDYAGTMAVLNAIVGAGNMRMNDLVSAMGTGILPAAKSAGLSLQDVGAALATLTDNGVPAEDAATRLRMTFSLLSAPTKQAQAALESVGISQFELANDMRSSDGLLTAITDLKTHLEASGKTAVEQNAIIARAFGGGRSSGAILTLLEEADRLQSKYQILDNGVKNFNADVAAQKSTAQAQFAIAVANEQVALINFGNALVPLVNQVLPILTKLLEDISHAFTAIGPTGQKIVIIFLALLAALGPVVAIIGALIGVVAFLLTPFGALAAIITVLIGLFLAFVGVVAALLIMLYEQIKTHWTEISQITKTVWNDLLAFIKTTIDFFVGIIVTALNAFFPNWKQAWQQVNDVFFEIWEKIKSDLQSAITWITDKLNSLSSFVTNMAHTIMSPIQSVINAVSHAGSSIAQGVGGFVSSMASTGSSITKFASGGIVNGPTFALVGEAGPEAIIPLSMLGRGGGIGAASNGGINIYIQGGTYLDQQAATVFGNQIAKLINAQLKLRTY